ncbi:uncharacterized protein LOC133188232 [Saccostrea echinata]|uniref:uncharacterized protein LOC133188232 n=1 Tax=Saccostrea echinata TaxID=191078 RepID=UPI002A7FCCE3|nr:uncharacterized protein LOC133188232 [Saccostrea echinata]
MDPRTSAKGMMRCDLCETAVVQITVIYALSTCVPLVLENTFLLTSQNLTRLLTLREENPLPSTLGVKLITKNNKHLDEINKKMSDIKDEINLVEIALDTNDLSKLFSVPSNEHIYRNLPNKITPSLPIFNIENIKVEELSKLFGALSSGSIISEEHGYSIKATQKSPEAGSSPPVKQLLDEPETITTIDTEYRELYNVACLSDEEIWTSGDENNMKLYSINLGLLLKSNRTKSLDQPSNIAVSKSGDLVYTDYMDGTVNIVQNEKI